uniref:Uncharacterized protein n=1 Tax=Lepeophtheirus salmonis TaxID=72036 RepID=A0A0K2TCW1_LEPSM
MNTSLSQYTVIKKKVIYIIINIFWNVERKERLIERTKLEFNLMVIST